MNGGGEKEEHTALIVLEPLDLEWRGETDGKLQRDFMKQSH